MRMPSVRQILGFIVVIFIVFAILSNPVQSAHTTSSIWEHVEHAISSLETFFDTLLSS